MTEILATALEVSQRILDGEDSQTEFKGIPVTGGSTVEYNAESFAGEIVAFANATGGVVLVGVEDDGSHTGYGRAEADAVTDWVVDVARNNVIPPVNPTIRTFQLEGSSGPAHVVAVHVPQGLYHRTGGGRYYVRVGRDKRDLDPIELERLVHERGSRFAFDESAVPDTSLDDLDEDLLSATFAQPEDLGWAQVLRNRRVLTADDPAQVTLAGLVAFGRTPEDHLPQAQIRAVAYRGTEIGGEHVIDQKDITGPIGQQIDHAVQFVDRLMRLGATKDVQRRDHPQFHLGAVMEAVVNAVAHRDYAIVGSRTRLFLFDDRLEVRSPGGLPNTLDLESMRFRQYTRNQLIVSFLTRLQTPEGGRYIEERGEGIERILRLSREVSGRDPEFALDGDELRVTLWGAGL